VVDVPDGSVSKLVRSVRRGVGEVVTARNEVLAAFMPIGGFAARKGIAVRMAGLGSGLDSGNIQTEYPQLTG
jgi:antitoxin (DNA-binding transcriptional repressor) of toxin-antitoxin stability system